MTTTSGPVLNDVLEWVVRGLQSIVWLIAGGAALLFGIYLVFARVWKRLRPSSRPPLLDDPAPPADPNDEPE